MALIQCSVCGADLLYSGQTHPCVASIVDHPGYQFGLHKGEEAKRGRPRIGEVRAKPWLECVPPMSERTYRRRRREAAQKEQSK